MTAKKKCLHIVVSRNEFVCQNNYEFPICIIFRRSYHRQPPKNSWRVFFSVSPAWHYLIIQEWEIDVEVMKMMVQNRLTKCLKFRIKNFHNLIHFDIALICKMSIWILHINWMIKMTSEIREANGNARRIKIITQRRVEDIYVLFHSTPTSFEGDK